MSKDTPKEEQVGLVGSGINRKRAITMLFSFLLASVLWFLVIINQKNHQSSFTLPIAVRNLPENIDFEQELPGEIEVEIKGLGVDLLVQHFQFRPDTVFLSYFPTRNYILTQDYYSQIKQKTPASAYTQLMQISPDTIPIQFELRKQKKIKLTSRVRVLYPPNYQAESIRIVQPDSVMITGSESILDTVKNWFTVDKELAIKQDRQRFVVNIDTLAGIRVSPSRAIIEVSSQAYTQKNIHVNLIISDPPTGVEMRLQQQTVILNCLVPLSDFESIPSQVDLIIPFEKIDQEVPYFIPPVEQSLSQQIKIVTRNPLQVSYVVVEGVK